MQKFYTGTNRIADAIGRQQERIDALVESGVDLQGKPIAATLESLDADMALSTSEHVAFKNQQARAAATGRLNTDEALLVYHALGEWANEANGGWRAGVGLAEKVVITQLIGELLSVAHA
jgi:hypothetical protein